MKSALIIEDEDDVVEMISQNLTGIAKKSAGTISQALDLLREYEFDIVLLDLDLPDSGPERTAQMFPLIRRISHNAAIIIVTGHPQALSSAEHDADFVLKKPFNSDGFATAMSAARLACGRAMLLGENADFYRSCDMIFSLARA